MADETSAFGVHPDRLFPTDPETRAIARQLHAAVQDQPIVSPHGHVDPLLLAENEAFSDPAALLITPDHYVTRLLHADGVPLGDLGVGRGRLDERGAREVWRHLCTRWHLYRGTPVRYWLEAELAGIFGVTEAPTADNADRLYDQVAERLAEPAFRPRALYEKFGIEVLATTDDPCDDLAAHAALTNDPTWTGRVVPTFRPDRYLEAGSPTWHDDIVRLGESADIDTGHYSGYVRALEVRRQYFIDHGATSADHSHADAGTEPLDAPRAEAIFRKSLRDEESAAEAAAFRRHMISEMARMSCDDGLVMMMHPGVRRGHHSPTVETFGPNTGSDVPLHVEFTDALRPLLERFGTHPGFQLVLFTLDESTWSRDLAPLAGFYPSVYVGVPWWFLDAPEALRRFRSAVTETAGFTRTSGFVDDTRAFCSIPARHEMARRIDAGYLAQLVAEHRLNFDEALDTAADLAGPLARRVFKL